MKKGQKIYVCGTLNWINDDHASITFPGSSKSIIVEALNVRNDVNTPEIKDFVKAIKAEAIHQRLGWPAEHDAGKTDADWYWLVGHLAGKSIHACDIDKALHHIITTAAACLNWHSAKTGQWNQMRPDIDSKGEV